MTKKDFIALADEIKRHNLACADYAPGSQFSETQLLTLADFCTSQNPRFNRTSWLDYIEGKCGKNGGAK